MGWGEIIQFLKICVFMFFFVGLLIVLLLIKVMRLRCQHQCNKSQYQTFVTREVLVKTNRFKNDQSQLKVLSSLYVAAMCNK